MKAFLKELLRPAGAALRAYWMPFLTIQCLSALLVLGYFRSQQVREIMEQVGQFKMQTGWTGVFIFSALGAGIMPELFKWAFRPAGIPKPTCFDIAYTTLMFGLNGLMVEAFYVVQNAVFGKETEGWPLVWKVLVDQFIFSPFIALPLVITWFLWRENGFNPLRTLRAWNWALYRERLIPIFAPNVMYWLPMVSCIYQMPFALQFPLFLCAVMAWSLLLVFMLRRQTHVRGDIEGA